MNSDEACLERARQRVQRSAWFSTFFAIFPVACLGAIGVVAAAMYLSPAAGFFALLVAAGGLTVPWIIYARQVNATYASERAARDGLLCPECYYDLAGVSSARCPECGAERRRTAHSGVSKPAAILGHGVDLVEVARIAESVERHGQRFLDRVFTSAEQAYAGSSRRRFEHLAARFAAKEAALKALGTGWRSGIAWTDIEIVSQPSGAPALNITGRAAEIAADRGIRAWHISLSHTEAQAIASVIATDASP